MGSPTVSVIMVAYNVAPFIDEAIQSVLSQEGVSFELLIGYCPSADPTWARISAHRHEPCFRVRRFPRYLTIGAARNRLIASAQGAYLSICDPDDVMLSGNLKVLTRLLDRRPDAGIVSGDTVRIGEDGRLLGEGPVLLGPEEGWDLTSGIIGYRHGSLMRRDLVREVGGYPEDLPLAEDYDLLLKLSERSRFVALRGQVLYCWRKRRNSVTHLTPRSVRLDCLNRIRRDTIRRRYGYQARWR